MLQQLALRIPKCVDIKVVIFLGEGLQMLLHTTRRLCNMEQLFILLFFVALFMY